MNFIRQSITTYLNSIKKKTFLYLSIVLLQIVSLCSVFLSMGIITYANTNFQNADIAERAIFFKTLDEFDENGDFLLDPVDESFYDMCIPISKISEGVDLLKETLGENLINFQSWGFIKISDNNFASCVTEYILNNYDISNPSVAGDEPEDKKMIVISSELPVPDKWKASEDMLIIDEKQYRYKVSSEDMIRQIQMIAGYDTPESVRCYEFNIYLKSPMLYSEYNNVKDIIEKYFNPIEKTMPKIPDLLETQMNNAQIAVAVMFIAISVINCSLCYSYIYQNRKKQLSIYRICGATALECIIIYLSEVIAYSLISYAVSLLLFNNIIKEYVIQTYPSSEFVYTSSNFLIMFIIYIILTMIIMLICIISFVKKPIVEEKK